MNKKSIVVLAACTIGIFGLAIGQTKPKNLPSGLVAAHLSGRLLVDENGRSQMVGYYTFAEGVTNLFNGEVAPANARLTFRTDPFELRSHLNGVLTLLRAAPLQYTYVPIRVYYDPAPARDFDKLETFETGQLVATFHTKGSQTTILPDGTAVNTGSLELVSSEKFEHEGKTVNIKKALGAVTMSLYAKVPVGNLDWKRTQWPFGGSVMVADRDKSKGNE